VNPRADLGFIALAAGGTGGHLFPAQALAQELKRRGRRVLLVTDARGARFEQDFPADDRFQISAASPHVGGPIAKLSAAFSMAGGLATALRQFRRRRVAAAIGFGGYPSLPAMKAAALLKIPYGLHEQNGVLGRANRFLASDAAFVAHGFGVLDKMPPRARTRLYEVGNPVRDAVAALAGAPYTGPDEGGEVRVLVFGGSQGASIFSSIAPRAVADLPEALRHRLRIAQQAREGEVETVQASYDAAGVHCEIAPFFADLPARIANAHLVISRAGASTVTEIATIGRPSVLVPLGIAMDDHQSGNARVLSGADGAVLMPEKAFTADALGAVLGELMTHENALAQMAAATAGQVRTGAAAALADLVEEIAVERRGKITREVA